MKIDAKVWFNSKMAELLGRCFATIPVDMDYVEANSQSIDDWVKNEIDEMFGCNCDAHGPEPFVIHNMDEIIEEIKYNEFKDKTQYANM